MEKEMRQDRSEGTWPSERPKVSICIPAYNNEAEVRRLLSSIAAQSMQDVEKELKERQLVGMRFGDDE